MSRRLIGPTQLMGPVAVNTAATIVRNAVVRVTSGTVSAVADGADANLALAMDSYPDAEFRGTKSQVDLARLGEDCEIEVPFAGATALAQTHFGGGPYRLLATAGGTVDIGSTVNGVFTPLRPGRNTRLGNTSGFLIGVFTDAASF